MRVDKIVSVPVARTLHVPTFGTNHDMVMVSDSSDYKAAVYNLHAEDTSLITFAFTPEERQLSSGMRELLAVLKMLQVWNHTDAVKGALIYWITDSSYVVSFLHKSYLKIHVQQTVFKIAALQQQLHIKIIPVHLLRSGPRIQFADDLSKLRDLDDWSLDDIHVKGLISRFRLHTDVFCLIT